MPRINGTRLLLALFLVLSASSAPQASQRWIEKRAENSETTQAGSVAPQRKAMTLWEARKAILETLPRVINHREWEVAWGSYDDEDVTISAARVSAYTIEYDYTYVRYTRRYSYTNGNTLCSGRDSGTDKLDLKKIAGVVEVVSPGWIPAGGRRRRYTKSSCLGYCLTAGGEYVDSYLVWSGYQKAKAVAVAIVGGIEEGLVRLAPIITGKVKTRTLENHKGTAPMICKLAKGAPPAEVYSLRRFAASRHIASMWA